MKVQGVVHFTANTAYLYYTKTYIICSHDCYKFNSRINGQCVRLMVHHYFIILSWCVLEELCNKSLNVRFPVLIRSGAHLYTIIMADLPGSKNA